MRVRLFIFVLLLLRFSSVWANESFTKVYTVNDGLAQNDVEAILKGKQGFLWIATRDGLSRFDGYEFKNYKANSKQLQRSVSNQFVSLSEDVTGALWILNDIGQVFRFDPRSETFSLYPSAEENRGESYFAASDLMKLSPFEMWMIGANASGAVRVCIDSLSHIRLSSFFRTDSPVQVNDLYLDQTGRRWLLTNEGPFYLSDQDTTPIRFVLEGSVSQPTYSMQETPNELYFQIAGQKAYCYDKLKRRTTITNWPSSKLPSKALSNVSLKDTMGVVWMAQNNSGLQKITDNGTSIHWVSLPSNGANVEVVSMMEDDSHLLWVALSDGSVAFYDIHNQLIGYLSKTGSVLSPRAQFGNVSFLYQDREGNIWVAMEDRLMRLKRKGNSSLDFTITECKPSNATFAPPSFHITDMLEDSKGHLWLASDEGGLYLLRQVNNQYQYVHKGNLFSGNYPPTVVQSHALMEDMSGNIWLGSSEGLTLFSSDFANPEEIRFLFYNSENTNLTNSCIYDIFQDAKGKIWLASFGGGLFEMTNEFMLFQTPEFRPYNKQNNLFPSDLLLEVMDDSKGNLWILTEESVVRMPLAEQERSADLVSIRTFSPGTRIMRNHSGTMLVSAPQGFYAFQPKEITMSDYCPPIQLTRFLLFNRDADSLVLSHSIPYTQEVTLRPNQSVFSVGYAAMDYRAPQFIRYAYMLEPFETEWNYVEGQRLATYTNLPKGEYTFKVKSTNSDGVWCDNLRTLKITVLPSFWETGWAYLFYALLLAGIAVGVAALYRMRTRMLLEQEMSDSKLQFFTDISHELRTPLTLISAPLENVLENGTLRDEDRAQLEVVRTNSNRMLRMMNQILDFRKIQNNKMHLKVEKTDLGQYVTSCSSNFLRVAENRNIQFSINDHAEGATFWVDKDKIDTVMFNLLSNAFKFTQEGKKVTVEVTVEDGKGVIIVSDEGCGMPNDKLSVIFDRYTTLQDYSLTRQSGTGIGLSLVKQIVDLHKATIRVQSELNAGSRFILSFLPGVDHFDSATDILAKEDVEESQSVENATSSESSSQGKSTLLIVEDNDQMREFLQNVLQKQFDVMVANNGKVGYETAVRELPSFIITDIMMPEMDGIEMTKKIRQNEQTSHIPIVLLTAKTDLQSKIDCMNLGANDYITKPFNISYLEARIKNILEERRKWQEQYRRGLIENVLPLTSEAKPTQGKAPEEEQAIEQAGLLDAKDDELMRRFIDLIHANMGDSNFSVEDAQDALKVSRWHLLSKVKSLVGMTPTEFIRETRLDYAAQLIRQGEYNMSQITYMIGMSDSRYFSRCFKQKFGMTPTEYKELSVKELNVKK